MKVVLKENIENLGNKGDIVRVAAGFGRNYLIPKKLALKVTASNSKMIEMEQAALKKNLEKARASFQGVLETLGSTTLTFVRKTAEKDVIFGSVTVADIKAELDKLGFSIEKKKILLAEPIKRLGNYSVPVKVFLDETAEIGVGVISEIEASKEGENDEASEEVKKEPAADQPERTSGTAEEPAEESEEGIETAGTEPESLGQADSGPEEDETSQ